MNFVKLFMEITEGGEWKVTEKTEKSTRYLVEWSKAKVQVFEFKAGYQIPRHMHETEVLHVILKGKIQTDKAQQILEAPGDYKCGGWEYGPWSVVEDALIVTIEIPSTK